MSTEKSINLPVVESEDNKFLGEKRPYSTPKLTEETLFERAVLSNCKFPPGSGGCQTVDS